MKIAPVLTIAGSDSSGGAGIQADLKTMTSLGVYGMSVITALTAQNSLGVYRIVEVATDFLREQIETVVSDIFPQATKTGMLPSIDLMEVVMESVQKYQLPQLVIDPIMIATTGKRLMNVEAIDFMKKNLFPLATLVTPNIEEAELLSGKKIYSEKECEEVAQFLYGRYGCAFLIKGGHAKNDANDYLFSASGGRWFYGKRIQNIKPHGCGCTFSAGIASLLAKGCSLKTAVLESKEYMSKALSSLLEVGKGCHPLHHGWKMSDLN